MTIERKLADIDVVAEVVVPKGFIPDVNCYFTPSTNSSSDTICANCGKEKFLHNPKYARGKVINYELEPVEKVAERYYQDEVSINAFINGYNLANQEPKQETLEEVIKEELENHFFSNISEIKQAEYFINFGAKWQQERMYSEEEVILFLQQYRYDLSNGKTSNIGDTTKLWFTQFKK